MDEEVKPRIGWEVGQVITPAQAMDLAIKEGRKGAGYVAPNPLVGCTILDRDHRLLAVGYHAKLGGDHAEVHAIKKIADRSKLKGSHVFVTLEPCAHQGRTPSCARTLAPLQPESVTYAVEDPNPLVAGKGAEILREAGVEVFDLSNRQDIPEKVREELILGAEDLAEIFLHNMRNKEPFVAMKVASTLDGKLALSSGESKWITSERSRAHVHLVRARYDAVAVGRNTFIADDPSLNVRHDRYPSHQNKALVFDPKGKTLASMVSSNLLKVRDAKNVMVIVDERTQVSNPAGVQIVKTPTSSEGRFLIPELLNVLKDLGLSSILIEGGAQAFAQFVDAGKISRIHAYLAPTLLGGRHGISWSSGFGVDSMADRIELIRSRRRLLGPDLYWTAKFRYQKTK